MSAVRFSRGRLAFCPRSRTGTGIFIQYRNKFKTVAVFTHSNVIVTRNIYIEKKYTYNGVPLYRDAYFMSVIYYFVRVQGLCIGVIYYIAGS